MQDWIKKGYFVYGGRKNEPEAKFYSGECAMMTTSSAALRQRSSRTPSSSSAMSTAAVLRRRAGRAAEHDHRRREPVGDGAARSRTNTRASPSSSLPVAARDPGGVPPGDRLPADHDGCLRASRRSPASTRRTRAPTSSVEQMIVKTTDKSRGIRLGNFVQIRDVIDEELEHVLGRQEDAEGGARRRGQARQRADRPLREDGQGGVIARTGRSAARSMRREAFAIRRYGDWRCEKRVASSRAWLPYALIAPQLADHDRLLLLAGGPGAAASRCCRRTPSARAPSSSGSTISATLFNDEHYLASFKVTAIFSVLVAGIGLAVSLVLAVFADRVLRGATRLQDAADLALRGRAGGRRRAVAVPVQSRRSASSRTGCSGSGIDWNPLLERRPCDDRWS